MNRRNSGVWPAFRQSMPRYFFHLHNSIGDVPDEQGCELSDIESAISFAVVNIRSIVAEGVRQGRVDLRGRIDIADEDGNVVEVVRFSDAVTVAREEPG